MWKVIIKSGEAQGLRSCPGTSRGVEIIVPRAKPPEQCCWVARVSSGTGLFLGTSKKSFSTFLFERKECPLLLSAQGSRSIPNRR